MSLLFYFFNSEVEDAFLTLIINTIVSIIFLLLGIWASEKPFTALVAGLILYGILFFYRIIDGQKDMFGGIVTKIFIIIYLLIGISSARQAEELKKELDLPKRP